MKILMTGATGFIGKELGKALVQKGHQIVALSRNQERARHELPFPCEVIEGDLTQQKLEHPLLSEIEAVIHLAGENVGDSRWTEERKKRIWRSRVDFTQNLMASLPLQVQVFLSASAVGYYGDRGPEILDERSSKGQGFLSEVCESWERSVLQAQKQFSKTRFVIFRTAVVLSAFGGALMKMLPPFQMGVGGVLGSGEQWMSWIHIEDLVQMYLKALEDQSFSGVINAVAPEPVSNRNFTEELAKALGVRKGPTVPRFALKTIFGEMASVVLDSQRVTSLKMFPFRYSNVHQALANCAAPYREGHSIFYSEQYFPRKRDQVFAFFSEAQNLEAITPPLLQFQVENKSTSQIQQGTLIDYRLQIHGVPVKWRTLIDEWKPTEKFVDIQLKGPYKSWHHTHLFEDLGEGTLMTDIVRYQIPLGFFGKAVTGSFVRGDVEKIFAFRRTQVPQMLQMRSST